MMICRSLWQSYDCYAPTENQRVITLPGGNTFEIRNRADRNIKSTGYVIRFKQLEVINTYDERTIQYIYDSLSRLNEANYNNGAEIFTYGFDLAGNLTNLNGTSRTYNEANQLIHDGTDNLTYDANGNMTSDGTNAHTWDHANRLLSMGGVSYQYNGDGNRIQQDALKYILDLQPGLSEVIGDSDGNRYVHAIRGIHAVSDGMDWQYPLTDALGSVRAYADASNNILSTINYSEWGVPSENVIGPAFTGEWRNETGLQHHRARHLNPGLGVWVSLDPFEGVVGRPMSLNGYSWVEGQFPNATDASGNVICSDVYHSSNRNDWNSDFGRCLQQVRTLRNSYGIRLGSDTRNGVDDWTSSRVANVYNAVQAINSKLSPATRRAIGDTNVILSPTSPDSGAARASNCNTIRLFLQYTRDGITYTDVVHTVRNIVHEFGHTFTQFRNNQPFDRWREISVWKVGTAPPTSESDNQGLGISGRQGWEFGLRENRGQINNLVGEQVPDMFMFWVLDIPFAADEFGQIRSDFANGGNVRNLPQRPTEPQNNVDCASNPTQAGCPLFSEGFRVWANNAISCSSASADAGTTLFVSLPVVLSNGACGDGISLLLESLA